MQGRVSVFSLNKTGEQFAFGNMHLQRSAYVRKYYRELFCYALFATNNNLSFNRGFINADFGFSKTMIFQSVCVKVPFLAKSIRNFRVN